jgi:AraC-like DNA-binding protein
MPPPYRQIQQTAGEVAAAVCCKDDAEARQLLDVYLDSALAYAADRVPVARGLLLPAVYVWLGYLERRAMMPASARQQLIEDFVQAVEASETADELTDAVSETFERVLVARRAADGPKVLRLETALSYIDENFTERLHVQDVARRTGFSVPAFTKIFRCRTGTSFLRYIRALRVEHAKNLLRQTDMSPKEIAVASGFQSTRKMGHSFHVTTGGNPRLFRTATLEPIPHAPVSRASARSAGVRRPVFAQSAAG